MEPSEEFKTMTPEEIEDWLITKMQTAKREADQIGAAKLLMQRKGMIQHGNVEKKDYREIVIGSHTKAGDGSMTDQ